jgi:hypothetical protein
MELAMRASGSLCVCACFLSVLVQHLHLVKTWIKDVVMITLCVFVYCVRVRAWKTQLEVMMLWDGCKGAQFTCFTSTKVQILTHRGDQLDTCSRARAL